MVSDLLQWLYEHPNTLTAVDTETASRDLKSAFGLRVDDGRGVCIGVSLSARVSGQIESLYVPFNHRLGQNADELTRKKLAYVLRQPGRTLTFANVQFDFLSLETVGIRVSEMPFYDILTMANLVREDFPFMKSLDTVYEHYVNASDKEAHGKLHDWEYTLYDEVSKRKRNQETGLMETLVIQKPVLKTTLKWQKENNWLHTTPEMIDKYACHDTEATLLATEALLHHPGWWEQPASVWENKQKLIRVLTEMKRRGVRVDVELAHELELEGIKAKEDLLEAMGGLNPSSVKDAPKIFLEILGMPVLKMTAGGKDKDPEKMKPSFTKEVLEEYDLILENREGTTDAERQWIANVRAWRGWTTALGLLLRPYQERVSPDGRLRTSYTTHVTSTGRLSSREPNLQQISKEADGKPWKDRIKKCFKAKPGYVLLSADYSQLELRLAVAYAQEPELLKVFEEGRDIFTEMSERMGWTRPKTKSFVYAVQYGAGDDRVAYIFGVSKQKAHELREDFYRAYPRFRMIDEMIRAKVEADRKVKLWSGRIRHFSSKKDSYKGMNAVLQGGAADVVERVWVWVMENLDNEDCRCLLQVHDALVFEVKKELVEEYRVKIREAMVSVNEICSPDRSEPLFPVVFDVEVSDWE